MSKADQAWTPPLNVTTLLICDSGGRVQATSSGAAYNGLLGAGHEQKHFTEIFGSESRLTGWLSEQMSEARKRQDYRSEVSLDELESGNELPMVVRLESLHGGGQIQGFAVQIFPRGAVGKIRALAEGDSVFTREQWHDVKNHLGSLKLYATFLKKKLPEGDELRTVEKMLRGIDVLIEHMSKIRRGEAQ